MPEDVVTGQYRGVMADHEVERFKLWDEMGDEMIVSSRVSIFLLVSSSRKAAVRYSDNVELV